MQLFGLAGEARSGKNTAGKLIAAHFDHTLETAFADPLKRAVSNLFDIPFPLVNGTWSGREAVDERYGKSPREILQIFGTECMRDHFGKDFWVNKARTLVSNCRGFDAIVFTDVRFDNEARMIQELGGRVIHVVRPRSDRAAPEHSSEEIDFAADYVLQNVGTLQDLEDSVDAMMRSFLFEEGSSVADGYPA